MPLAPPVLPGYVVERRLGGGSSGDVWQARIARTGERVALKRIPLGSADRVARARSEAAVLSVLDHPHLVRLHGVLPLPDAVVLVLDLAAAGSLADLLVRRRRLTPGEVVTALSPVAAALAHAHTHGVQHGDVSAANVVFTEIGLPMLTDLGLARLVGEAVQVGATPAYVDPVIAAGSAPVPGCDVFALGAVALHALTGLPPWAQDDAELADRGLLLERAARADFGPGGVAARLSGVPEPVADVLRRALADDPAYRPTAADVALDLRCSVPPTPVDLRAGRVPDAPVGDPVAVRELRDDRHVPRHAAPRPADGRAAARRSGRRGAVNDAGRPDFARPSSTRAPDGVGGLLTHTERSTPRPTLPPVRSRGAFVASRPAAVGALVLVVGAGLTAVGVHVLRAPHPGVQRAAGAPALSGVVPAAPAGTAGVPRTTEDVRTQLDGLDTVRARAFAAGDGGLLAGVYAPGPLLDADRATLAAEVPAGCSLPGLRTRYTVRSWHPAGTAVVLTAEAVLPPTVLRCPGAPERAVPGAGPTVLVITLAPADGGARIVGQSTA